jgi:CRP-like cAMP-binding protein
LFDSARNFVMDIVQPRNRNMQLPCHECALRACGIFKPVTAEELNSINQIKRDHLLVHAGSEIIRAGDKAPELYTLYSGWAFRFKTLPDGRRQILNFLLPGDLLGLQAAMFDAALHGIEALTEVELCVLARRDIWALFGDYCALQALQSLEPRRRRDLCFSVDAAAHCRCVGPVAGSHQQDFGATAATGNVQARKRYADSH